MAQPKRALRIGIDVGGTFTHAVAIDAATLELVGRCKVPTTHQAAAGVAAGVVMSLRALLEATGAAPEDVLLIAHSTTQATNALLEGDVATVGVVGAARGTGAWLACRQTAIRPVALGTSRRLQVQARFLHADHLTTQAVQAAVDGLVGAGVQVVVAAEAFSVDDARGEKLICQAAQERGLPATATHLVSKLHGLGVRTRTAVINACMLPRMLATAEMTERAVREAGIAAPLMIMRSDGGVMDIDEMRRRPILTMLSGPAAGVAAALLYARVCDGVFLEVGGTSTDICVIRGGRSQVRSAVVGGHRLFVSTLDVRTVGVAGGSLVYLRDRRVERVGPRSAHIAGLGYLSFAEGPADAVIEPDLGRDDGESFLAARVAGVRCAVTPTCAANYLGLAPPGDPAHGRAELLGRGLAQLAAQLGYPTARTLAEDILSHAVMRPAEIVTALIADYRLDQRAVTLVAGGGGASAIVPYLAQTLGMTLQRTRDADVISAIGVALALVREMVERTVVDPTDADIRDIRAEAQAAVLRMGAVPESVQVFVEVDAKRNLLRATAEGATQLREGPIRTAALAEDERRALVQRSMGRTDEPARVVARGGGFEVWAAPYTINRLWRFFPQTCAALRVLDASGSVRLAVSDGAVRETTAGAACGDLEQLAERFTVYSDAGVTIPRCYVLLEGRVVDLSGLVQMGQVQSVLRMEVTVCDPSGSCVLIVDRART